jgi:hypothetical protein
VRFTLGAVAAVLGGPDRQRGRGFRLLLVTAREESPASPNPLGRRDGPSRPYQASRRGLAPHR